MGRNSTADAKVNLVEYGLNSAVQRKIKSLGGLLVLAIVAMGAASLATWHISDPSFSHANGNEVKNALGFAGASFADLAMQFLGLASAVALIPAAVWGWMKLFGKQTSFSRYRAFAWLFGVIFTAAALGCINPPPTWQLPVGLGGVIGDLILKAPASLTGAFPRHGFAAILFFAFMVPALWLLLYGSGLIHTDVKTKRTEPVFEDEDDEMVEDKPGFFRSLLIAPLGLLTHWFFSIQSWFRRRKAGIESDELYDWDEDDADYTTTQEHDPQDYGDDRVEPNFDDPLSTAMARVDMSESDTEAYDEWQSEIEDNVQPAPQPIPSQLGSANGSSRVVAPAGSPKPGKRIQREAQRSLLKSDKFELPSLHLLSEPKNIVQDKSLSTSALEKNARRLEGVLEDFGVKGEIVKVHPGPVVTLYELEPAPGIKSSRVIGLADDIARSMSAMAVRVAVVPGRNAIGIELPNKRRETVYLREQLASEDFEKTKTKLALCLGKTIGGETVIADLAKMPHLLVAGTTGSGKSVAMNTMILSLLYKHGPEQVKLIMIDPKMLELSIYDGIPHLLTPVVTDPKKAVVALKWTVREMEDRYKKMSKVGVRNIDGFNARVAQAKKKREVITRTVQTGFDRETGEAIYEHEELDLEPLPYIVVLIDEMADLMMVAGKDIEGTVQRLAQMARAAGIHVIMATQRPSVDVITGTIKANFPTRISFQVTSKIDSRTILGEMGAEQLLGMGDMLYMAGGGRITRVHGPFVDDDEVEEVVNHLKTQGIPQYLEAVTEEDEEEANDAGGGAGNLGNSDDPYDQAVAIVLRDRKASTSYIQRRLSIGYNRAASLIERMEQEGLISPANHAGKRDILVPAEDETI